MSDGKAAAMQADGAQKNGDAEGKASSGGVGFKLGEHIGGSRADMALARDALLEARWMRSWKIAPLDGGMWQIEAGRKRFRRLFPSREAAEGALARHLAQKLLGVRRDGGGWRIVRLRGSGDVGGRLYSSREEAMAVLESDPKRLLVQELLLVEQARKAAARERRRSEAAGGRLAFPPGWRRLARDGGWTAMRAGSARGKAFAAELDAWRYAVANYVAEHVLPVPERGEGGKAPFRLCLLSGGAWSPLEDLPERFGSAAAAREWRDARAEEAYAAVCAFRKAAREDVARRPFAAFVRKGPSRRAGHAAPEAFMQEFGFRGVEFGLWNSQKERRELLDAAWDALEDLAELLELPPEAVSLGGELSLAFGARGRGGRAAAFYESGRAVVNLTKNAGAGALAHEWMHAFDHWLARKAGAASSVRIPLPDGGTGFAAADPELASYAEHGGERTPFGEAFGEAWRRLRLLCVCSGFGGHARMLDAGRRKPYWSLLRETAARAFEAFCEDRLEQAGRKSEFLVNGTHGAVRNVPAYPEGDERREMDGLFAAVVRMAAPHLAGTAPEAAGGEENGSSLPCQELRP